MPDMERWPTGRLLSTADRLVEQVWNEKLRGMGLTSAGVNALDVLAVTGPVTQVRLARIVCVKAQTIGQSLKRLESRGYVHRRRHPSDRRNNVVSVTDAGALVLEDARRLERSVLAGLSMDTSQLREDLQSIVRVLPTVSDDVSLDTVKVDTGEDLT